MTYILIYLTGISLSFYLLYFITNYYFIPALDKISSKFNISSDIAGSTLMAAGSSAPELAIMLFAIFKVGGHGAIGVGTIVGSALFNLFFIIGAVILIKQSKLVWQPLIRDLSFYAISIALLFYFFKDGSINLTESIILVAVYIFYVLIMFLWKKLFPYVDNEQQLQPEKEESTEQNTNKIDAFLISIIPTSSYILIAFTISIILICFLSWILVNSVVNISQALNISELFIGLTLMAVGTSIPDLFSSIIVAKKGRTGMAINNAIGSNIFDFLIGMGLPFMIYAIYYGQSVLIDSKHLAVSYVLLFSSIIILLISLVIAKWRTTKFIGVLLFILYFLYLVFTSQDLLK